MPASRFVLLCRPFLWPQFVLLKFDLHIYCPVSLYMLYYSPALLQRLYNYFRAAPFENAYNIPSLSSSSSATMGLGTLG